MNQKENVKPLDFLFSVETSWLIILIVQEKDYTRMIVKTRSASVALNDFPRIESNFVYTNLDRKNSITYGK